MILLAIGLELAQHRINAIHNDGRCEVLCGNYRVAISVKDAQASVWLYNDRIGSSLLINDIDMNHPNSLDYVRREVKDLIDTIKLGREITSKLLKHTWEV